MALQYGSTVSLTRGPLTEPARAGRVITASSRVAQSLRLPVAVIRDLIEANPRGWRALDLPVALAGTSSSQPVGSLSPLQELLQAGLDEGLS